MKTQNITLAIDRELLKKAKLLAVRKDTSLSGLLARTLEAIVTQEEGFESARQRSLVQLARGLNLQTKGRIRWGRESLHER
ncbi:MAG: CopG family transcriptional regulator [Chloroflexi bacterium]|nr:CopG family transcriptional regulator [Chloroflexota bacterium]MBI3158321.1 CopG family transcriptional regulator [Chloroflexota bacterium]